MPHDLPNVAPPLGFTIPTVRRRVRVRNTFIAGLVGQCDESMVNPDTGDLELDGGANSGYANGVYVSGDSARTGRPVFVAAEAIDIDQEGWCILRGKCQMWASGTGSAGDPITVGVQESGNRLVAIALEAWTTTALIWVLFDGIRGFGCYMASAPDDYPVVNITSPADGSEWTEGDTITFTATATDATDGDVSASLDWTSSIDGAIATNDASFDKADLSVGIHTITATAQDSGANEGSDSIIISVVPSGGGGNTHNDPPGSETGFGIE